MLRTSKFSGAKLSTIRRWKKVSEVPQLTRRMPPSPFELLTKIDINPKMNQQKNEEKQRLKSNKGNETQIYYKHTYHAKKKEAFEVREDLPCQEYPSIIRGKLFD
eukprot:TRINITY_DN4470_c0_g1_i3.p1 TRINITY_DN4470_c0_g1~~TRINITY_DN4470_c0_g1_i3.p1  ORF type:complete len:105 (-),score=14.28 TRINITY_DN4470_c0_g1_i3:98-412(-)